LKATGALHLKSSNLFPGVVPVFISEMRVRKNGFFILITVFMWVNHA
jgi:hypothetical protein